MAQILQWRAPRRQPYLVSNAPGGFHEGGSLAGNDSSEFSSTVSSDSDPSETRRLETSSKSTPAATTQASPTTHFRRCVIAICTFNDVTGVLERRIVETTRTSARRR